MILTILILATCALALVMCVNSGLALHRAERLRHPGQAYVLPIFSGLCYLVLTLLVLHDRYSDAGPRITFAVQVVRELNQGMLIAAVIMMIHRLQRRGD